MHSSSLIIVSGLPGTGKTTLAKKIADEFDLPIVGMGTIKEVMWDTMGHEFNFEFNDKVGRTAFELLFHFIEVSLPKGISVVVEAHFDPEKNNERINGLKERFGVNLLQVYCDCETETLRKRFRERMTRDNYHKGHKHTISLHGTERVLSSLGAKNKRLDINGATYDLNTTHPEQIDYKDLFGFIYKNIQKEIS